ncbi:MAG: L,D-transpeptidase [Deltaproteobacteria bacterium]|nr:L,D-transpeptidase [Deltaproteobacteria bacterium]
MRFAIRAYGQFFIFALLIFFLPGTSVFAEEMIDSSEPVVEEYYGPKITVNVPARQLKLYDEADKLVKVYTVAVGQGRYPTPIGKRKMDLLVWNPWWIPPKESAWAKNEKDTPPGPRNPLGPVKMKMGGGIMFHGTTKPQSVGEPASHGCMRMLSEQAIELADWLQRHVLNNKTDATNYEEFMANVQKHKRTSYYVGIERPVPVDIIYDIVEIADKKINIYRDVYFKVKDKMRTIEEELVSAGYDPQKFDWDYIKQEIKLAKNKKDLSFDIEMLLIKNKELRNKQETVATVE